MQIYSVVFCHVFCVDIVPRGEGESTGIDKEKELSYAHPISVLEQINVQV
jgi:hypothetical protein